MDVYISWCSIERPRQIAVVRILQSQLRSVSGDLTIRPLLSTSEDLGMKTVLLAANSAGTSATLNHVFVCIVKELRAQSSSTPVETTWNPIGTWSGFLFCGQEFIKFISVYFPTYVVRSLLNKPQDTRFKDRATQYSHGLLPDPSSLSRGWPSSSVTACVKTEHWFLAAPRAKTKPALCKSSLFSCETCNNVGPWKSMGGRHLICFQK